jgi:hypothetical protein
MSSRPRATGNHAIAPCPRGRPRTLDGRRLRERTATSFPGSCRSNPSRIGAGRDRIHRRKRGWGRPSASKTAASKAKIATHRWAEQGAFLVTHGKQRSFRIEELGRPPSVQGWPFRPRTSLTAWSLLRSRSCQCRLKCSVATDPSWTMRLLERSSRPRPVFRATGATVPSRHCP